MSLRSEVDDALAAAQALGIARYLEEHPDASVGDRWLTPEVAEWRERSVEEIAAEARRRLEGLAALRDEARAGDPASWESVRVDVLNAQMNLHSVESGTFQGAAGGLFDFLREAGANVASFDVG